MIRDLPRNVTVFTDRHGRPRYRFRKVGLPARYMVGEPGTPLFDQSYEACMKGLALPAKVARLNGVVPDGVACVYFVGGKSGPVKIGWTKRLGERLVKLQCGCPFPLRVLACVNGTRALERAYHDRFSSDRINGEWFARSAGIRSEIARLKLRNA